MKEDILKMEALRSSATSITVYQSTRRNDRKLETSSASLPGPQITHSIPFVLTVRSLKHCSHFHRKLKNVHSEMHTHEEKSRKDGVTNLEQNAQYFRSRTRTNVSPYRTLWDIVTSKSNMRKLVPLHVMRYTG